MSIAFPLRAGVPELGRSHSIVPGETWAYIICKYCWINQTEAEALKLD